MILNNINQKGYILSTITEREASLRNAAQFKSEMTELIDEGHKRIVLNFTEVTYIDSSFLGSMVSALKHAIAQDSEIYLVNLSDDILNLLTLIRMNKVFTIFKTIEEATVALS